MNGFLSSMAYFWQAGGVLMPVLLLVSGGIWYLSLRLCLPLARADRWTRRQLASGASIRSIDSTGLCACERQLRILRALVAVAPLLGLLGTVKGMIATFIALGRHGTTSMDCLSVGISEALITTQVGLVVALPGLVGAHAAARALAQVKNSCERLLFHASDKRSGETSASAGEATP